MNDGSRRWWPTALVWLLLLLGCATLSYGCFVPRVSEETFRREVEAALPLGTRRSEVEAWLKARRFACDGIVDRGGRNVGVSVLLPDIGPRLQLADWDLYFEFHFDEQDRLEEFFIRTEVIFL